MAKELPKRSEVKVENTWRVEDMYATLDDWKADIEKVKKLSEQLSDFQGKVGASAENLYEALFTPRVVPSKDMLLQYASKISSFVNLFSKFKDNIISFNFLSNVLEESSKVFFINC